MRHSISKDVLDRFALGHATPQERKAIAVHLLHGCDICAKTLRAVAWPGAAKRDRISARDEPESPPGRMKRGSGRNRTSSGVTPR